MPAEPPRTVLPAPSSLPADDLRASDAEREQVAGTLREHAGNGRLTFDELDERVEAVFAARTRCELTALTKDLPRVRSRAEVERRREHAQRELHNHVTSFVVVNLALIAVWAATGAGYFWPIWPLLGWGIGVASHASAALRGHSHGCGAPRDAPRQDAAAG